MNKIEIFKDKLIEFIKEADAYGIEIQPYAERIEENGDIVEAGIALMSSDSVAVIRTYKNDILVGN